MDAVNATAPAQNTGPGISDAGRAITEPGGLQPGQTLEVVLQNPTGYHFFRGYDILCVNSTNNYPAGQPTTGSLTAALRTQVFAYGGLTNWDIVDYNGDTLAPLGAGTTASAGMKYDLTLTSTNTYVTTLTPLSNPSAAYTQSGTLDDQLAHQLYQFPVILGPTTGPNDPADDLAISSMTIAGLTLNIQLVGANAILSWPTNVPGFNLASSLESWPRARLEHESAFTRRRQRPKCCDQSHRQQPAYFRLQQ